VSSGCRNTCYHKAVTRTDYDIIQASSRKSRGEAAGLEAAKPQVFNGTPSKVSGFVMACKLYGKAKMRRVPVEEQIQWVLSYVQGRLADVWKENVLEELEAGELEFETVGEFLAEIKKEFSRGEEEAVKAAELRKMEQRGKAMEEFIQEFKRAARGSGYEEKSLVEEFKREINSAIRRKLMEAENQPGSIEQWYKRATALDRNWRESRREKERLKERKEPAEAKTDITTTPSMAEEANALSAGNNRACSNGRS